MQEIRILVVDATFLTSAPNREKTCRHIVRWVQAHGASVYILTSRMGIQFYKSTLPSEIVAKVRFCMLRGAKDHEQIELLKIVPEYMRRICGAVITTIPSDLDVIYSISSVIVDPIVSLILKLKCRGARVFVTFDNFVPAPPERPGKYIYKLIPYLASKVTLHLLRYVDGIFAYLTADNESRLNGRLQNRKNNYIVRFTNGLDLNEIAKAAGTAKYYDLIFVGRLHPAKGIWDFLEVVLALREKRRDIKSAIIGVATPDVQADINKYIDAHNLSNYVDVVGYVPTQTKYELLKSSKIFLFLSHDESFPVAVLEAIACGLPVLAYDLDVFASPPYNRACIKTIKRGDAKAAIPWLVNVLDNYDELAIEAEKVSNEGALIPSYEENADKEFNLFMGQY